MELLDRYLQAVKKYLPTRRQNDIIAELRANMESQIEDKESELGRPLTVPELEELLKKMGPPVVVASRYQPQQYLIGPSIFPMYWYVLRLAFLWATAVYAIVSTILILASPHSANAIAEAILRAPGVLMTTAAWVTLVFAVLEFVASHYPEKCPQIPGFAAGDWNPSNLPPLEKTPTSGNRNRTYSHAVAEVVFGFVFLSWLLLVPHNPYLLFGPGAAYILSAPFQLAHIWVVFFWWIITLNFLQLLWRSIDLWRGAWQQRRPLQEVIFKAIGIVPLILLITTRDHIYFLLKDPSVNQARYGATLDTINRSVYLGMSMICAIASITLAWDIIKMAWNEYREREAAR